MATSEANDRFIRGLTVLAECSMGLPHPGSPESPRHGWNCSRWASLYLEMRKLSRERTVDPYVCVRVSLLSSREGITSVLFSPQRICKQRLWLLHDKDYQLDRCSSLYFLWICHGLAFYICFLLHECLQIIFIWQTSGRGLSCILMHEHLQTWMAMRDLFCSCRSIHNHENYCIPLKTLSWITEEGCRILGIERGKIMNSKSDSGAVWKY